MKTQIEIHFKYLDNKRIYFIFKTCCLISVLISMKYNLFHDFISSCSNNTHGFH